MDDRTKLKYKKQTRRGALPFGVFAFCLSDIVDRAQADALRFSFEYFHRFLSRIDIEIIIRENEITVWRIDLDTLGIGIGVNNYLVTDNFGFKMGILETKMLWRGKEHASLRDHPIIYNEFVR